MASSFPLTVAIIFVMPIPELQNGLLPIGVHDCTFNEVADRFGSGFRRHSLTSKLAEYLQEAKLTTLIVWVGIDGSYVTDKPDPNDIDLVVALRSGFNLSETIRPFEYNIISKKQLKKFYPFDALVAPVDSEQIVSHLTFFQSTRDKQPKGILRLFI